MAWNQRFEATRAFKTSGAVVQYGLVALQADGTVQLAGAADSPIGVAERAAASGEMVSVRLMNAPGTMLFVASEIILKGNQVAPQTGGKVQGAAGNWVTVGAAAADGDYVECARAIHD